MDLLAYEHIRSGRAGFNEQKRGLIAVWGKEAVQFLDGMVTNDIKTLEDGQQMLAAFPNAQGRLLAVVRIRRDDDHFYIETEEETRDKVYQNLFRFTFAGDFFVKDVSELYRYFEIFGSEYSDAYYGGPASYRALRGGSALCPLALEAEDKYRKYLEGAQVMKIDDDTYETLRIENGMPIYGVDMDETTVVPELGLPGMISYTKGCYIGQEIIARIHFRGHVAKQLAGLVVEPPASAGAFQPGAELTTADGKNAGRITSVTYSPKLEKTIALGYVRYDYLEEGTQLAVTDQPVIVKGFPLLG